MAKVKVKEQLYLDGDRISFVIEELQKFKDHEDAYLSIDSDGYGGIEVAAIWHRDETSEETRLRVLREQRTKEVREFDEKKKLKELLEKYPEIQKDQV